MLTFCFSIFQLSESEEINNVQFRNTMNSKKHPKQEPYVSEFTLKSKGWSLKRKSAILAWKANIMSDLKKRLY